MKSFPDGRLNQKKSPPKELTVHMFQLESQAFDEWENCGMRNRFCFRRCFFQAIKTLLISTAVVKTPLRSPEAHVIVNNSTCSQYILLETHVNLLEEFVDRQLARKMLDVENNLHSS